VRSIETLVIREGVLASVEIASNKELHYLGSIGWAHLVSWLAPSSATMVVSTWPTPMSAIQISNISGHAITVRLKDANISAQPWDDRAGMVVLIL